MDDVQENQIEKTTTVTTTTTAAAAKTTEKKSQKNDVNCNMMADARVSENGKGEPSACMHACKSYNGFSHLFVVFLEPGKRE